LTHIDLHDFHDTVVKMQKQIIKADQSDDKFIACADAGKAA